MRRQLGDRPIFPGKIGSGDWTKCVSPFLNIIQCIDFSSKTEMPASISLCTSQGFAGNAQEWAVRFGEKQTAVQLLNQSRTIRICRAQRMTCQPIRIMINTFFSIVYRQHLQAITSPMEYKIRHPKPIII